MKLASILFLLFSALLMSNISFAGNYTTLNNETYAIDFNQPEKPVVLIVWASWCGYCMEEIPHLKEELKDHPEFTWLGLNVNKNPEDGRQVEVERALPWLSLSDPDLVIGDQFKVRGTPTLIVLNSKGDTVYRGRRTDDEFKATLDTLSTEQ
jgi:thiol-disulfide isomerase/thioredoxin